MAKLHQVLAIEGTIRADALRRLTDLHRASQKPDPMTGLARTYAPRAEDGYPYPGEAKKVQFTAREAVADLEPVLARLLDVTLARDEANTRATASVVIDGQVILEEVPATYLLWLEKQLATVRTFFEKLPVLDPAEAWTWDPHLEHYVSEPVQTAKTKKVPRAFTKAEATDRHPAQVDVFQEDVPEGTWTLRKFSGALPASRKSQLLDRATALLHAVKYARQQANETEARPLSAAAPVFGYLLAP
jgi:hypothetical protein